MSQKLKNIWKLLFDLKYMTFFLSILIFISFILSSLVIGFDNKLGSEIITLRTLHQDIVSLRQIGEEVPMTWINSFNLMIWALGISAVGMIILFINLLPLKKIEKIHSWFYWSGIVLELVAMILIVAGESLFIDNFVQQNSNLKFSDCWGISRFIAMILCSTILPLILLIYAIWKQVKKAKVKFH